MKFFLFYFFSITCLTCIGQDAKEINRMVNVNKGTFVIREIRKKKGLHRDSAEISIRFFSGFCRLIKSDSPNSITFFLFDNQEYKTGNDGGRLVKIKKGKHSISLIRRENSLYYANFSPIRRLNVKLRSRRYYAIDIYLSLPFLNDH